MQLESSVELIRRAQSGDEHALTVLLARYLPRLQRWASGRLPRYARDLGDTSDVVQEAVIGTVRNFDRFENRGEGALQAYLRQAVLNRIRTEVRRAGRQPFRDALDPALEAPERSPLELAIGQQAIDRYERALSELSPDDREAVIARVELGCTYDEVAQLVGKPSADAARMAVARALTKLAHRMAAG
jgi:RNA polymerase sigma-70 factor (ECF subfamily)